MILGTYKYTHITIIINNKIYNDRLIEYDYEDNNYQEAKTNRCL